MGEGIVKKPSLALIDPSLLRQYSVSKSDSFGGGHRLSLTSNPSPSKKKKSPSKFKSLKKNFARRLSITGKKKKNKLKRRMSANTKSILGDVDELQQYGFDHDAVSFQVPEVNQIYFMMGSVFVSAEDGSGKVVNLYQEINAIRKQIHQNVANRVNQKNQSEDEIISSLSVNEFFVRKI